jgi:hypothetical protein
MKDKKDIIAIACAVVISVVAAILLSHTSPGTPEAPVVVDAPVPDEWNPPVYLVKVTAHNPGGSHVGVGTLVEYDGYTFVLTSKMIFTPGDTHYTVTADGEQYSAMMIGRGDFGLIALALAGDGTPIYDALSGLEVNDQPNIPPDASVRVWNLERSFDVNVIRYLTDPDWLLLDGDLPGTCTGAPITTSDGSLAGVVIGVSTENAAEAFAVGNHAIRAFAESVINPQLYVPRGPPVFPYNPNDMGNVFRKPTMEN